MAGSRLEKIGTIFTRTTGLLKSGAMKKAEKPMWYEVYEAFPPKYEPLFNRKYEEKPHRQILYPEDEIRAIFYKKFGSVGVIDLYDTRNHPTVCQSFVEEYQRLQSEGNTPADDLVKEATLALEARGIYLEPSQRPVKMQNKTQSTEQKPPEGIQFNSLLADLFGKSLDNLETEQADKKEALDKLETEQAEKKEALDKLETEQADKKEALNKLETEQSEKKDN